MNGERAEKMGHEKSFSKKPCPVQRFLGMDGKFAKRNFWHRMRRFFSREIKGEIGGIGD